MRVKVLGAGIIGLSVADELLRRGHRVTVVDPAPGAGASYAAAGMLSPSAELWHHEEALLGLGRRSLALWGSYADRLGVPVRTDGTLLVGYDAGDRQQVARQVALVEKHGGRVERCADGSAVLPDEASTDPRAVVTALLGRVPVVPVDSAGDHDATVLATGATLPSPYASLVRGVRGEILRLRSDDPPARTLRGWVHGDAVYVVPRHRGEVVVGATSEEHDAPPVVTAGGVRRLLTAARALWPALDRAELVEATARDRPCTPDNLPLVGPAVEAADGVVLAAGHYRHGVLLAPLTAYLVADHLETGVVDPVLDPRRFTGGDR
ncbi:FAD-dependent oxidoreductase [Nocardioides stalactiti]|uniref:FAD-dependent oxidoreductase n=1 Tax=Nocardioides stalactiti TaxID=2755356 RepID=UPI001602D0CC|nr:FAD-dependent oxidoreductase [Nocardioides stalactiti]